MRSYKASRFQRKAAIKKKAIKRRRFLRSKFFCDFVLGLVFFIVLFYWMFFSSALKIKNIQVVSPPEIASQNIEQAIKQELNKKWLFVKKDSFFLVDTKAVKNKILLDFPLIGAIKIKKGLPATIFVEAKLRIAEFLWCFAPLEASKASSLMGFASSSCFLADQQGIIFALQSAVLAQKDLIEVFSQKPTKKIFDAACSKNIANRIIEIQKLLSQDFGIGNIVFEEKTNSFLIVKTRGWEIYFDSANDLSLDLTKLRLLLDKEITPEKRKNLQYIDLRFSKAYYK